MRKLKPSTIFKIVAMLVLIIPFIVVACTAYSSFYDSKTVTVFYVLLLLMLLETFAVVYMLAATKNFLRYKKTALGTSIFLIAGWIIALVAIFATKSKSVIPAEHVFGGIYATYTLTAIVIALYSALCAYGNKKHKAEETPDSEEGTDKKEEIAEQPETENEETAVAEAAVTDESTPPEGARLTSKQRRKLERANRLKNKEAAEEAAIIAVTETEELNNDTEEKGNEEYNESKAQEISADAEAAEQELSAETEAEAAESDKAEEIAEETVIDNEVAAEAQADEETDKISVAETEQRIEDNSDEEIGSNAETEEKSEAKAFGESDADINIVGFGSVEPDKAENEAIAESSAEAIAIENSVNADSDIEAEANPYEEAACDALSAENVFADSSIDEDFAGKLNMIVAELEGSEEESVNGYKPVKIDVFANDTEIPEEIEVVKNDFVPTGKFSTYAIKDETRGKYEEIENENERKVALMTDLSKVIITSNINATIVPLETEILERTFENKLKMSDPETKDFYSQVKNALQRYEGVKSRLSKLADTFKYDGGVVCKIMVSGKTLLVNLNLDCNEYDAKYYKFTNVGEMSRFAETPMQIRIKNKLALKRCLEIIDKLFEKLGAKPLENAEVIDYASQYPTVENAVIFMNSIAHLIRRDA